MSYAESLMAKAEALPADTAFTEALIQRKPNGPQEPLCGVEQEPTVVAPHVTRPNGTTETARTRVFEVWRRSNGGHERRSCMDWQRNQGER